MSLGHGTNISREGLIFCIDAQNIKSYPRSGTALYDLSNERDEGILGNGVTYSSGSLDFDGVNQYAKFSDSITDMTTENFTVSAWVKSTGTASGSGNGIAYRRGTGSSASAGWRLNMPSGGFNFYIADGTSYTSNTVAGSYNDGAWWNVVGRARRGDNISLWVNGVNKNEEVSTFTTSISSSIWLGIGALLIGAGPSLYHPFTGGIGNIMIHNRDLPDEEIKHNYNVMKRRFGR